MQMNLNIKPKSCRLPEEADIKRGGVKKMQDLPIGIQSFEILRKRNYLYVDKTVTRATARRV